MTTISTNQVDQILIGEYTKGHFINSFKKTYKQAQDITRETIQYMISHLENFLMTTKVESIHRCDKGQILKCEFKIANSRESTKTSGNRTIVYHEFKTKICHILLVYSKTHFKSNETSWWEKEIKENYKDLLKDFSNL